MNRHAKSLLYCSLALAALGVAAVTAYVLTGQDAEHGGKVAERQEGAAVNVAPSPDVLPGNGKPAAMLLGYDIEFRKHETAEVLASLPVNRLSQDGPDLFKVRGPPQDAFLYRALYKAHRDKFGTEWHCGSQGIGDCVSWGWAHACDVHLAIMYCQGDSAEWRPVATESIYGGSRVEARNRTSGGWSDGSYGAAAAKWIRDYGLIFREPYPSVDLTTYSARRARDWGNYGNGGKDDNGKLDAEAKKSPVRTVAMVKTYEEAVAAIQSGYPVPVCSGQGFDPMYGKKRDDQGFASPAGGWAHCMCFTGVRHDRPGLLCQNSWGEKWVTGPKWPDDQPDGSFWVDKAVVERMLRQNDSFSVSGYDGFPFNEINHFDWVRATPNEEPIYALAP